MNELEDYKEETDSFNSLEDFDLNKELKPKATPK